MKYSELALGGVLQTARTKAELRFPVASPK